MALDCVNATKDYVHGRALVEQHVTVEPQLLADSGRRLKELLASSVIELQKGE